MTSEGDTRPFLTGTVSKDYFPLKAKMGKNAGEAACAVNCTNKGVRRSDARTSRSNDLLTINF